MAIGGATVAELQERMSSAEFQEWRAYYSEEPFGDLRDDFRTGIIASIVRNLAGSKTRKADTPLDFVTHRDGRPAQSPAGKTKPTTAERRASQEDQIKAMKATLKAR